MVTPRDLELKTKAPQANNCKKICVKKALVWSKACPIIISWSNPILYFNNPVYVIPSPIAKVSQNQAPDSLSYSKENDILTLNFSY